MCWLFISVGRGTLFSISSLKVFANWMHEDVLSKKWMQIISWFLFRLISHYMQAKKGKSETEKQAVVKLQ